MSQAATRRLAAPAVPREIVTMAAFAAATGVVVASGAGLSSLLPEHASMWLNAGAYAAPASIAFTAYWWVAQKL
jgi:hypothetical protein